MKFILSVIVIGILSFVAGLYTPWWSQAIVSFLVSLLIVQRPGKAFLSGFLAIFLTWFLVAAFINAANNGILANRIGELLGIGARPLLLVFITALVGAIVGGFAALTASYLRK